MENKTLKPGQLATVEDEFTGMRGIVRATKKAFSACHDCFLQRYRHPCGRLMSVEKCQELFGSDMFPMVIVKVHKA